MIKWKPNDAIMYHRLNRKTKFYIEKDVKDKFQAQNIDEHSRELNVLSSGLKSDGCTSLISPKSLTAEEWQQLSHELINKAESERQNAIKLRSFIDTILQQAHCDLVRQKERTDLAFEKRIRETKETKAKLEDHLNQVLSQIREMEENVDRLQKAICEKEPALRLAITRMGHREQRPNNELCRDPAQYRLMCTFKLSLWYLARIFRMIAALRSMIDSLKNIVRYYFSRTSFY